jgi:hypothetical protein
MNETFISNFIYPFFVSLIVFYGWGKSAELSLRKNKSKLGAMLMEALVSDVQNGLNLMKRIVDIEKIPVGVEVILYGMPTSSWNGSKTFSEDILLRLVSCTKKKEYKHFHPTGILVHSKNYFEHMCPNVNKILQSKRDKLTVIAEAKKYIEDTNYIKSAEAVLSMLKESEKVLNKNSKSWFWPK